MFDDCLDEAVLHYAAAIIDGDGSIVLESDGCGGYKPVLRCEMRDHTIPSWLRKTLPTGQRALTRNESNSSGTMGIWRTGSRDTVYRYLEVLEPFLIEKRHRAIRLLQWIRDGEKGRGGYLRDVGGCSVSAEATTKRVQKWTKQEQLSWMAGIIEAEGHIRLGTISIRMDCWPILRAIEATFGGRVTTRDSERTGTWTIHGKASHRLLMEIMPYMRGSDKWNQAQIYSEWLTAGAGGRVSSAQRAQFEADLTKFKYRRITQPQKRVWSS